MEPTDRESAEITRRVFLQHSAALSALTAGACGLVFKTDALSQATGPLVPTTTGPDNPYPYHDPNG